MTDVLAQVRTAIEARLREIREETQSLQGALAQLDGGPGARRRRRTGGSRRRRASRPTGARQAARAPRGQRQQQFLDAVKKKPGAPVAEIARDMSVAPQQLYAIARRLRQRGQIRKRRKGYAVKA